MTWKDFFGCDWDDYAQRISSYTTERLCKQEIVKTRQQVAAGGSIGGGIAGAAFSFGSTLAVSVYGSRRLRVAYKKLELIQMELASRNIKLHHVDYKDFLIPLGASIVGAGVGFGLDEVAIQATNAVTMGIYTPSGSSAVRAVAANPGDALQGLGSGFIEQVKEMAYAFQEVGSGIIPGSDLSHETLVGHTSWVRLPDPGTAVGFYAGMLLAQSSEKAIGNLISAQCAWSLMEAVSSMEDPSIQLQCSRMVGMPLTCSHCSARITAGTYWRRSSC